VDFPLPLGYHWGLSVLQALAADAAALPQLQVDAAEKIINSLLAMFDELK
jgi:hypothetical protein